MGATAELFDAWADLVHGSACLGCGMPGRAWCRSCAAMLEIRVEPRPVALGIDGVLAVCAGEYEGWLREVILAHKERSAWSLATPLGSMIATAVGSLADRGDWWADPFSQLALVPIPSRRRTVRIRGHDPTLRMAREAARRSRLAGMTARAVPLLHLRLPVKDSVGLSASQRGLNLDDAFAVLPAARRVVQCAGAATRIVVCDDVMTTGTTLRQACAALALAGLPASGAVTVAAVGRYEHSS